MRAVLKSFIVVSAVSAAALGSAEAGLYLNVPVPERARRAHKVAVATVETVRAAYRRNTWGDQLIVSTVTLRVTEGMKGSRKGDVLVVETEGGTVGDVTLVVSDLPRLDVGERGVFFLEETPSGVHVPHGRGLGILKLDAHGRVRGEPLNLDDVRAMVSGAGR